MEMGDIAQKPYNRGMFLTEKHPIENGLYLSYSYTKYAAVCWFAKCHVLPGGINFEGGDVWQQVWSPVRC